MANLEAKPYSSRQPWRPDAHGASTSADGTSSASLGSFCALCAGRDPRDATQAERFNWICPWHAGRLLEKVDRLVALFSQRAWDHGRVPLPPAKKSVISGFTSSPEPQETALTELQPAPPGRWARIRRWVGRMA